MTDHDATCLTTWDATCRPTVDATRAATVEKPMTDCAVNGRLWDAHAEIIALQRAARRNQAHSLSSKCDAMVREGELRAMLAAAERALDAERRERADSERDLRREIHRLNGELHALMIERLGLR